MKTINVNGFEIGGEKTYIIADIGSNHKQDLSLAKESIDAAAEAGADAIKFQSIQLNELYLNPDAKTTALVKQLEFPEEWHFMLKEYCDKKGVVFFSSPTYLKAVDILEEINVPVYKLASAQVGTFPQIVDKVASLHKPTIFSTGIAAMYEIAAAVAIFKKHNNDQYIILHCNSIYPTPPEMVNLPLMQEFKKLYGNPVGFSDHTNGTHIACTAVAMGAQVIEKHFTLNRNLGTPDSNSFACDPTELKLLVTQIRDIERAMQYINDRQHIQDEEQVFKNQILYKCIANKNKNVGELLTIEDISFLRTAGGIDAIAFMNMGNKCIINKNVSKGELITETHLRYE
jgi:sialic acid synthase SpsE